MSTSTPRRRYWHTADTVPTFKFTIPIFSQRTLIEQNRMDKTQSWYSGQWGNTWNGEWTPPWQAVCGVLHSSIAPVYWGFGWRMRPLGLSHQAGVVTALPQFRWCWHPCPKWRGLCCSDSPVPVLRSAYVVAHRRPLDTSWTIRRLLPILSIVAKSLTNRR